MSDDGKKDAPEEGAGPFDLSAMKDMLNAPPPWLSPRLPRPIV